ncbi:MAG: 2-oxoacid:ferredoxin oxidoreductase subunit beta [Candidatus Magnetominusculus sp. LBB02]|nr:2-oxoacid:ferredoxin oxidoreductase subunit beta [Candidatus Magnetominusculus sp. LBB02]
MNSLEVYKGLEPAWCTGCGNYSILGTLKAALAELQLRPSDIVIVSGIGQAAKLPHYLKCNTFNGLHGRALPPATGIRLANHEMPVIVISGDGDCYGEGGNHLIHTIRRNMNITLLVHDNQVYGLTKGQASPTTTQGVVTKTQPFGANASQLNPIAMAIGLDCSFVARGYAADNDFLKSIIKEAISHKGFALVDIFQPCVTFNKLNTYAWYKERVYRLDNSHNPRDCVAAFKLAVKSEGKIPTGIIYRHNKPTFEERIPILKEVPLVKQGFSMEGTLKELKKFY